MAFHVQVNGSGSVVNDQCFMVYSECHGVVWLMVLGA